MKAMGGFQVSHGLFYFCLFLGRFIPKKAMDKKSIAFFV